MIEKFLEVIAPHACCNCGQNGNILCHVCLSIIVDESVDTCLSCGKVAIDGLCSSCRAKVFYQRSWVVGAREAALEKLINSYKFSYAKAAHSSLADLLDAKLPVLPAETVVVPIPTIARHVRQRGYDHAKLMAQSFAKRRQLKFETVLSRVTATVQREATSAAQRRKQAREAFRCRHKLGNKPYLIIDDVVTTGSTLESAAKCLKKAGAREVWLAAIARQPLDSRARR